MTKEPESKDFVINYAVIRDWSPVRRYITSPMEASRPFSPGMVFKLILLIAMFLLYMGWFAGGAEFVETYYCNKVVLPQIEAWQLARAMKAPPSRKNNKALVRFVPVPTVPLFCVHLDQPYDKDEKKLNQRLSRWLLEIQTDPLLLSCVRVLVVVLLHAALITATVLFVRETCPECPRELIINAKLKGLDFDQQAILHEIDKERTKLKRELDAILIKNKSNVSKVKKR